jgi:hypothetical protein
LSISEKLSLQRASKKLLQTIEHFYLDYRTTVNSKSSPSTSEQHFVPSSDLLTDDDDDDDDYFNDIVTSALLLSHLNFNFDPPGTPSRRSSTPTGVSRPVKSNRASRLRVAAVRPTSANSATNPRNPTRAHTPTRSHTPTRAHTPGRSHTPTGSHTRPIWK